MVANGASMPLTIEEAARALRSGSLSSAALTEAAIARADRLDSELGCYVARFDDAARASAAAADAELANGNDRGPLHGIPVGVKDILSAAEGPTTAQSLVLDPGWGARRDAPVVARLRAAGAVITGKTSTMEFAIGVPDPDKPFPLPRNPWDTATWPGGSSSGTGNGVAAGLFLAGIGTDTGGSIRMPAAFCGVSGLMPTFGRVPKSGCVPLGYSLDHIGPLARSAWDCAAMLQVLAGHDATDPYCSPRPVPDYLAALDGSIAGLRIGVEREHHLRPDADAGVVAAWETAVAALAGLGATVVEVSIPYYAEVVAATTLTLAAEAFAYHRDDLRRRWGDYFRGTRALVPWGALVSAADYVQAQRVRRVGQRALARLFADVDVIVTPTATMTAPTYDELETGGLMALFARICTAYWDGVGNPVLAVPVGAAANGLPCSMQIAGRPFDEATVLRVGDAFQRATDWHRAIPAMAAEPTAA